MTALRTLLRPGPGLASAVLVLTLASWLVSLLVSYDVTADVDVTRASVGPSLEHWLGTDHLGRDVAWRVLTASEAFVGPGLLATAVALLLGVSGGALAGWFGGATAGALRYGFTVVSSVPRFVLVLLACTIFGNSVWLIGLVAGLAYVPAVGEAVFTRIEAFRSQEFVLAARAHGVHPAWVLGYHLLWINCGALLARHALQLFAYLLLLETTLSYIGGFGVAEPTPSLGNMIAFEWGVSEGNIWAAAAPALAIWAVIMAAFVVADALAEGTR